VAEAAARLPVLDAAARGLEYVEQPCATLAELRALRARTNVPIAVDEGVRLAADTDDPRWRRAVHEAADVVVLKPTPLGGVARALVLAERLRTPVVVSGAMDTSVGLAAGVALAAALPDLPHACGLGTGALLADDVVATPSRPRGGRLPVVRPRPDPDRLAAAAERLGAAAAAAWAERMRAAWDAWDDASPARSGDGR
jgi:O-succinylbenzoate synthase